MFYLSVLESHFLEHNKSILMILTYVGFSCTLSVICFSNMHLMCMFQRRLRAIVTDIRRDLGVQNVGPVQIKTVQYSDDFEQDETQDDDRNVTLDSMAGGGTLDSMAGGGTTMSTTQNTFEFNRTNVALSTIRSQPDDEDLSALQALQQYQMDLTVKDNADESKNGLDHTLTSDNDNGGALGSTLVNGDAETLSADGSENAPKTVTSGHPRPAARLRRLTRQDASTAGQESVSRQTSITDTDAKTEEDQEEEYEDDYDADEDDGTQRASDDDF